jgi:hypothetical protein
VRGEVRELKGILYKGGRVGVDLAKRVDNRLKLIFILASNVWYYASNVWCTIPNGFRVVGQTFVWSRVKCLVLEF